VDVVFVACAEESTAVVREPLLLDELAALMTNRITTTGMVHRAHRGSLL
jgi:hypothetical protein